MNENLIIFDLVKSVFGKKPRTHYKSKCQAAWDCPVCSAIKNKPDGDGKGNFEVNYGDEVFKCWVCSETEGTKGSLYKFFKTWGTPEQLQLYRELRPNIIKNFKSDRPSFGGLPEGFISFVDGAKRDLQYKQAYNYIKSRGITDDIIEKFNIGYTIVGKYRNRIVIPSKNDSDEYDYFTARTFINTKPSYLNPESPKEEIIFNSRFIDWDADIYLVEGGLDHVVTPNSIPMLGKKMSPKLWDELYEFATKNIIICLDPDAIEDAIKIYRQLDGGKLLGRIRILEYNDPDSDLCQLYKELTKEEFNNIIKKYRKLKDYE